jgi:hypothetical protein
MRGLDLRPLRHISLLVLAVAFAGDAAAQSRAGGGVAAPSLQGPPSLQAPGPLQPSPNALPLQSPPSSPGPTIVAPGGGINSPLAQPALPPAAPVPVMRSGEGALQAVARFGRDAPAITAGLHWRIYSDRPDANGGFRLIKEDRSAQPTFVLPQGNYIVHVAFGLASVAKPVQIRSDGAREVFELPAGGIRLEGRVGDVKIPNAQISFDVYKGSQFEQGDRRPISANVLTGEVVLVPEGTYYILSKYGDGNSVVRSDIRVQSGKLTDVSVTHRAAVIMLKLVPQRGGEALANTDWAVMSPAGDVISESKGAFPRVILAEGEYKVIARNDNRTYQHDLRVITGVDGEIEVLAR